MKSIHIVAFNNPYPPDYGGAIDMYFKIKALHDSGVKIILHIFKYNRPENDNLLKLCETVYYYERKTGFLSNLSFLPYIVYSRRSSELLENLTHDNYPVLFEGLHSCYYLNHNDLSNKKKFVRTHNIEHEYYLYLARSTFNLKSKFYFLLESLKLRAFEKVLKYADRIISISYSDSEYFRNKYGKTDLVPAFHDNSEVSSLPGKGEFILMHANLGVPENELAVIHCIKNILKHINFPVVIAGKDPSLALQKVIRGNERIILSSNPTETEMSRLQHDAHIHLCYSFQPTGLKLKLLNSLFKGRFVVANDIIALGSGLEDLIKRGKTDNELAEILKSLIPLDFTSGDIAERANKLLKFSNSENAKKIVGLL